MNLPPLDLKLLMQRYDLKAKKSLGQNYLVDDASLRKIIEIAAVLPSDSVLEIGAGLGSLTRYLAFTGAYVVAVELDGHLLPALQEVLSPWENIRIVQGDILDLDPASLMQTSGYLVVANIPYYITSAVIRHLLESSIRPDRLILTVQREVAERICAAPGDMSLLALSVQVYGKPAVAGHISSSAFFPAPKVDSAIVKVELFGQPLIPENKLELFFRMAKAGFSQKRKMLRNSLAGGLQLDFGTIQDLLKGAEIEGTRRAETLSIEEWGRLVKAFSQL